MTIVLDGANLTIEKLVRIARVGEKVELHPDALARIKTCRSMLEDKIDAHEIMYGVNTGIGEFSEVVLNDDQVSQFQRYLIYNHAAGIGDPVPEEQVRAAIQQHSFMHDLMAEQCVSVLKQTMQPHALNTGLNLGEIAGSSIKEHLHMHIVPRWQGDNNFMPVLADMRMMPQALEDTYSLLAPHLADS